MKDEVSHSSVALSSFLVAGLVEFKHSIEYLKRFFTFQPGTEQLPALNLLEADLSSLQDLLRDGSVTSVTLVEVYFEQIVRHDGYLHAMLSMPTKESLIKLAIILDAERAAGKLRSPVHGIPLIIKDNINTHVDMGMKNSSGSMALEHARPKENAYVVEKLLAAGMIILGKANMGELSDFKGENVPSGWSTLGGQTQSPYVRGGVRMDDSKLGHSSPLGSSTGSAVVVAAGYTPVSLGTETDGSIVCPGSRAALYAMKPTIGLVSQSGICPISHTMDAAGPMAKTPYDVATLMDIIRNEDAPGWPVGGYTTILPCSMAQIAVAAVDYSDWLFPSWLMKPEESATEQMLREFRQAYDKIESKAQRFVENVPLIKPHELTLDGVNSKSMVVLTDFRHDFQHYLDNLKNKPVANLQALIEFNKANVDESLPLDYTSQAVLESVASLDISKEFYAEHLHNLRYLSRERGIDFILDTYDVDVIIGPADSSLSTLAAASGYPICSLPLGYLDFNGRPFGLVALARAHHEATLFKFMSAWEELVPRRKVPDLLIESSVVIPLSRK